MIRWSRHSRRKVPADRVRVGRLDRCEQALDPRHPDPIRSRIRYSGRWPQGVASISCRQTQAAVGRAVTSEVKQLAAPMADEEEHVEGLEGQRLDYEQIGRPDRVGVVSEKGAPVLAGRMSGATSAAAADGSGADHDAELQGLAAYTLGARERILCGHGPDEFSDLWFQAGPTQARTRARAPVEPPALAMPANDGLRPDQEEMASPVPLEAADQQPEELVPP